MVQFDGNAIIFAAVGGILLGFSTSLNYIIRGKVTGMSGIAYGIASLNKVELPQKLSIVGGMFFISSIFFLIFGNAYYNGFQPFGPEKQITYWTTFPGFFIAGLFVGFGTKLANGCTSGHGLCGLPRFSIRSLVAVCTFLCTAICISTFAKYMGLIYLVNHAQLSPQISYNHSISSICFIVIGLLLPIIGLFVAKKYGQQYKFSNQILDQTVVFVIGIIFAIGLMVSGMSRRANILQFLQINHSWNPALMVVLASALSVNTIVFQIMRKKGNSLNGNKVFDPKNSMIDWQLVLGSFCFGIGWGIGGLCPGPFFVLFSVFTIPIQILWGFGLFVGMFVAVQLSQYVNSPKSQPNQRQNLITSQQPNQIILDL